MNENRAIRRSNRLLFYDPLQLGKAPENCVLRNLSQFQKQYQVERYKQIFQAAGNDKDRERLQLF